MASIRSGLRRRNNAKLRTVTVLHYMEGYDVSELSRLLHIPKGTVTSRLHMARGRLREILKEDIE